MSKSKIVKKKLAENHLKFKEPQEVQNLTTKKILNLTDKKLKAN